MTWATVASILGSLATIFGGVRWLLAVYFKQQLKIAAAQKVAFSLQAELLHGEIKELKAQIRFHRDSLEALGVEVERMMQEYSGSKDAAQKVYVALGNFVMETRNRFSNIENGNHDVKPVSEGKVEVKPISDEKLGKVTVKK